MLTSRTVLRSCLVALSLATPLAFVAAARADVACGDQTCPKNYTCQSEPAACPAIACAADDPNCSPPACTGTVDSCVPLPCTADADCADGMVCYTSTEEDCPATPPCAAGQDCPKASDTSCVSRPVSACVPKYLLPCQADADCGAGFTCEEEQNCACSGSGSSSAGSASGSAGTPVPPTPAADGGSDNPPPPASNPAEPADGGAGDTNPTPPDCACQPSGTKACNLKTVPCSADTDCPAGFTCGDNPARSCAADANGQSDCTPDAARICLPPYARLVSDGYLSKGDSSGIPSAHGGSAGTSGSVDAPIPPTNASPEGAGASSGSASNDGGGCSIGRAPGDLGASFGFAALALAGFGLARRRRAR